jgi:CheY-like chemotaxis protein
MKTIMVVDDDQDARELMATTLSDAGFHVIECDNGFTALSRLVGHADLPDAIVLDLAMPVMSGPELLTVLRGYLRLARVPIIIVTGAKEATDKDLPIAAYVTKPYEPSELVHLVEQAVT